MKNPRFNNIHKVSDIVDAMIRGLKREWVTVKMQSFGHEHKGICYGCAATNTLCELMQEPFSPKDVEYKRDVVFNYDISKGDLEKFEVAIDNLRTGYLQGFVERLNSISSITGVSISPKQAGKIYSYRREKSFWHKARILPGLRTDNYKQDLHYYEKFRDWLIKKGL